MRTYHILANNVKKSKVIPEKCVYHFQNNSTLILELFSAGPTINLQLKKSLHLVVNIA